MNLILTAFVLVLTTTCTRAQESSPPTWTYQDQNTWFEEFPECGDQEQSPIDINTRWARENPKLYLKFRGYNRKMLSYDVMNNGRSIMFTYRGNARETPEIFVQGNRYALEQFHFHWGQEDGVGSEHTINLVRYDMEVRWGFGREFLKLKILELVNSKSICFI